MDLEPLGNPRPTLFSAQFQLFINILEKIWFLTYCLGSLDNIGKKEYVAERTWEKEEKCQEYLPKVRSSTSSSSLSSVSSVQHLTFLESQLQVRPHLRYYAYIVAQLAKNLPAVQETRV